MTVAIRPLRTDEAEAAHVLSFTTFVDLDRRLGESVPDPTEAIRTRGVARVAHLARTDPGGAWAADRDGELVGVALATRRGPLWFLSLLTVAPGLQGEGVGRRLLDAALRHADGATAGLIMSSPDPRALRRYASAGFELHAAYDAKGTVDRTAVPADLAVREGDLARDGDLVEDVVTRLRGAAHGPDLDVMARAGFGLLLAEDGAERGFCVHGPDRLATVGATTPALAQRLLWAGLGAVTGEVDVSFVTADQQWALPVLLAARLSLKPGSSQCRRGALGPMTPYLPTGAYG